MNRLGYPALMPQEAAAFRLFILCHVYETGSDHVK